MRNAKYTPFKKTNRKFLNIFNLLIVDSSESVSTLTWKRIVYLCISVIFLIVFQEAIFNDLRLFNAKPNLVLIYVYTISVIINVRPAMFFGLLTGLYIDINYGRYLGVYALQLMLFAVLISAIGLIEIRTKPVWSLSIAVPAFFIYTIFESFVAKLITLSKTGGTVLYSDLWCSYFKKWILPITLYDAIIFLILFIPIRMSGVS